MAVVLNWEVFSKMPLEGQFFSPHLGKGRMYLSFYELSEKPFDINTDPRFLWRGEKHQEALANLKYGLLEANGYVLLTGDVGTGKTTLVNALIEMLDDNVLVANINHPALDTIEFFNLVANTYDASAEITF